MKITIIGTGYVGLVTGACFSEMGNKVHCVDIDADKIKNLKRGIIQIYEPNLEKLVVKNSKMGDLNFTKNLKECLNTSDICFICVNTPMCVDGSSNIKYVLDAAVEIGRKVTHDLIVVNKSTVPLGTTDKIKKIISEELEKRGVSYKIHVVSNPEFLKEGNAIEDFMRPDRVIIGSENERIIQIMKELYAPFTINHERFIIMDIRSAEMTKYASNAMLATRISFINEIANICEKVGANINHVREGMGSDHRIGYNFLYAGCGYGGSCLSKDVKALIKIANEQGYNTNLLKEVEFINEKQKSLLVNKIKKRFSKNLSGYTFAVWGLSFKPGTDDMRGAPSVKIIRKLVELGAKIKAYDPIAMNTAKEYYFKNDHYIEFSDNKYLATENAHALILVTEWKEFRSPDFEEISKLMKKKIIFDGRNQYDTDLLKKKGFEYYNIGKKN